MIEMRNWEWEIGNDAISRLASRDSEFPIPNSQFASSKEAT